MCCLGEIEVSMYLKPYTCRLWRNFMLIGCAFIGCFKKQSGRSLALVFFSFPYFVVQEPKFRLCLTDRFVLSSRPRFSGIKASNLQAVLKPTASSLLLWVLSVGVTPEMGTCKFMGHINSPIPIRSQVVCWRKA